MPTDAPSSPAPGSFPSHDLSGAVLTVDVGAVRTNYRRLCEKAGGNPVGAAVKADAYGTGLAQVAPALAAEGCTHFFVAQPNEGINLRAALPNAQIHVLNGALPGTEDIFTKHRLKPVLNSLGDIEMWRAHAARTGTAVPCDIHLDTGMSRLGLPTKETDILAADPALLTGLDVGFVLSHLACADVPDHPLNAGQLAAYRAAREKITVGDDSLAASYGLYLGAEYRLGLIRPGGALYGLNPIIGMPGNGPNPMAQVVRLQAKILQVRDIDSPQTVGYGASHRAEKPARIATLPIGYADGYLRSLSNSAHVAIGGVLVPVVGRVSMDLITIDVSTLPENACRPGTVVDVIGPHLTADEVAAAGGTIGYELLTSLGRRYPRVYTDQTPPGPSADAP